MCKVPCFPKFPFFFKGSLINPRKYVEAKYGRFLKFWCIKNSFWTLFGPSNVNKLDGVALLVADQPNASSTTYTDTHLLCDIGDSVSWKIKIGKKSQLFITMMLSKVLIYIHITNTVLIFHQKVHSVKWFSHFNWPFLTWF